MQHKISSILLILLLSVICSVSAQGVTFNADVTEGCWPLKVTFTDATPGANLWEWNFGEGSSSALAVNTPVSRIYGTPGVYTVWLKVNGSDSASIDITVYDKPTASFSADNVNGCPPFMPTFTDESTTTSDGISSWFWNFGNGAISTEQNPTANYPSTGTYNVQLTVTDINGCLDDTSITSYINVGAAPTAAFSADNTVACAPPLNVNFINQSTGTGTLSYEWILGDGNTSSDENPSNNYTDEQRYDVTLIVNDDSGCPDTLLKEDYVGLTSMTAGFEYSVNGCGPSLISFTDTSGPTPTSWSWSFPGGTPGTSTSKNPIVNYASSGTKFVTLQATNDAGCTDQKLVQLTINPAPVAVFTADETYSCERSFTVNFSDFSSNATAWEWNFGDGNTSTDQNPTHTYVGSGLYNVTLTAYNDDGCSNTRTLSNYIEIHEPVANYSFDVAEGCIPLGVQFTDESTSKATEPISAYQWRFQGGTPATSSDQNPAVTFNSVDSFDVQLIVTNINGCRDTLLGSDTIAAGDLPSLAFSVDPLNACADSVINFTNLSTNANEYEWDFGDGGTSENEQATHIYADTGYFDIQLAGWNNGCPDTLVKEEEVYILPPIAIFTSTFNCDNPFDISFTDLSIDAASYEWDFGDGNTSTDQNPNHTYVDTSGFVLVSLTVTQGGCSNTDKGIVILADPQSDFNADSLSGCIPFNPGFSENSVDGVSYNWIYGDGNTGSGAAPTFQYQVPGIYDVTLITTGANGCADSITKTTYVEALGSVVDFSVDTVLGCTPFTATFEDLTTAKDGIKAWEWQFGTFETSSDQNPVYTYNNVGSYTVALTVTDNNDCQSTTSKSAYVRSSSPIIRILTTDLNECPGLPIQFLKSAFGHDYIAWDFGDGLKDSTDSPLHTYASEGTYEVVLSAGNSDGCKAYDTTSVDVSFPDISILTDDTTGADCPQPPLTVQFEAGGDAASATGTWEWDFGDGNGSSFQNPFASYSSVGDFDVKLKYTTTGGCADSVVMSQYINIEGPSAQILFPDTADCAPLTVAFDAVTTNADQYSWDFKDGTVVSLTEDSVYEHTFMSRGIRYPQITLFKGSCSWTMPVSDSIDVSVIPIDVNPDTAIICPGSSVALEVTIPDSIASNIASIVWSPTASLSSSTLPNTIATPNESTRYSVIVTDQNGCIGPDTIAVLIDTIIAAIPNADGYCPGDSVEIEIDTTQSNHLGGNYSFGWSPSIGLSSDSIVNPFAKPENQTVYTAIITDSVCSDTATVLITPFSNPTVSVDATSIDICYDQMDTMLAFGASTYEWSPNTGLDFPGSSSPVILASDLVLTKRDSIVQLYQVVGTDDNGCRDTNFVSVTVRALPIIPTPNDTAVCAGESVAITVDDQSNSYIWFPAEKLSDSTGQTVTATPDIAESYNIIGVDEFGCKDTSGQVFVAVHELPEIEYGAAGPLLKGQEVTLINEFSIGDYNYEWETDLGDDLPNAYSIDVQPEETTFYTVYIRTKTVPVCTVQDTLTIIVYDNVEVASPSAFTPNGDGENDEVYAYVKGMELSTFRFRVFDRWGQIVFETDDPSIGWDGYKNGVPLPMDTYILFISGRSLIDQPVEYKMDITLIR